MVKVCVIEDDPLISQWLCGLLTQSEEIMLTSVFSSTESALADFQEKETDVALVDIHLPGKSGIACVRELKSKFPAIQFMMCTVFEDEDHIFESLKAGASGYILKNTPADELIASILNLFGGGSPMSSQIARKVMQSFHPATSIRKGEEFGLSTRENEILTKLSRGLQYKEISFQLGISIETVRTHIRNIYQKLQVQSRTDAINKVFK